MSNIPWADLPHLLRIAQVGEGLADAWNRGADAAGGDFLAWLDSDDEWTPEALEVHLVAHAAQPETHATVGRVRFITEGAELPTSFRPALLAEDHLAYMPGATVVSRAAWKKVGPFREDLGVATDIEWFGRLRREFSVVALPHRVLNKRVHGENLSYGAVRQGGYKNDLLRALHTHIVASRKRA